MKINNFRTSLATLVLGSATLAVGMFSFSPPAQAWFKVCNKSSETASFAFAFRNNEGSWISRGWWTLESGECAITYHQDLTHKRYYVHARNRDKSHAKLTGNRNFCVAHHDFRIVNAMGCEGYGHVGLVGFHGVDIGESLNFTFNLVDSGE